MQIITERLTLRHARMSDAEPMHAILSDPAAMAYWSTLPHETIAQTRDWIASMVEANRAGPSWDFVVERDGEVIGKAGFWKLPEIGYILHPDHWGQGLAREALTAVIRAVFDDAGVETIKADVDPRNAASLALLGRLGFEKTGYGKDTWEIGGVWLDSVYLELKRPEALT